MNAKPHPAQAASETWQKNKLADLSRMLHSPIPHERDRAVRRLFDECFQSGWHAGLRHLGVKR